MSYKAFISGRLFVKKHTEFRLFAKQTLVRNFTASGSWATPADVFTRQNFHNHRGSICQD